MSNDFSYGDVCSTLSNMKIDLLSKEEKRKYEYKVLPSLMSIHPTQQVRVFQTTFKSSNIFKTLAYHGLLDTRPFFVTHFHLSIFNASLWKEAFLFFSFCLLKRQDVWAIIDILDIFSFIEIVRPCSQNCASESLPIT